MHAFVSFLCWLVHMRRCAQCAGVMTDRLLVLTPVVFNPSPEARISSSLSHRPALSLVKHLTMQALINTGMAILSVTEEGYRRGAVVSRRRETVERGEANKKKHQEAGAESMMGEKVFNM